MPILLKRELKLRGSCEHLAQVMIADQWRGHDLNLEADVARSMWSWPPHRVGVSVSCTRITSNFLRVLWPSQVGPK